MIQICEMREFSGGHRSDALFSGTTLWWQPPHLCGGGALQRSGKRVSTRSRALALVKQLAESSVCVSRRDFTGRGKTQCFCIRARPLGRAVNGLQYRCGFSPC